MSVTRENTGEFEVCTGVYVCVYVYIALLHLSTGQDNNSARNKKVKGRNKYERRRNGLDEVESREGGDAFPSA